MTAKLLLIANVCVTLYLTGLIWTIQMVHYPLFAKVGADNWQTYHALHTSSITVIVALPMLVELTVSLLLLAIRPAPVPDWLAYAGFGLTLLTWLATMGLSVPIHNQLATTLDAALVDRLVLTNWARTLAWTARSGLMTIALSKLL
jgi:hypothetical protein